MSLTYKDALVSMPIATYQLFEELSKTKDLSKWTLVGGTALSLYLKHRTSEDLDFFIDEKEFGRGSIKKIDELVEWFRESGMSPILTDSSEKLRDYMFGEVKVTFFASGLHNLKDNAQKLGSISIASIDQIAAMKLESILKYRTVTRDFFDIHTLWKHSGMDLYSLIDNYRSKYTPSINTELFERRFFDKAMDLTDPGFGSLKVAKKVSPEVIREEFLSWLKDRGEDETKILEQVENGDLTKSETLFGITRQSLLQKLCSLNREDLVSNFVKSPQIATSLTYEDFNGQNLFDYYKGDLDKQENLSRYLTNVPTSWLNSNKYKYQPETLEMLRYENAVIMQACQTPTPDKLASVAQKKAFDPYKFKADVEAKTTLLMRVNAAPVSNGSTLKEAIQTLHDQTDIPSLKP